MIFLAAYVPQTITSTPGDKATGTGSTNVVIAKTEGKARGEPAGSATGTGTATATVVINEAPVALCKDITVQLDESGQVHINPNQIDNNSYDDCGLAAMTVEPDSFDCDNLGENLVNLTITDISGNTATCPAIVTVEDDLSPGLLLNEPQPSELWPPNHKFVKVIVTGQASDNCETSDETNPGIKLAAVSVESIDAEGGDGNPHNDPDYKIEKALIDADGKIRIELSLRAERSSQGDGRIYRITVEVTDGSDNSENTTVDVIVPHDEGKHSGKDDHSCQKDNSDKDKKNSYTFVQLWPNQYQNCFWSNRESFLHGSRLHRALPVKIE